MTEQQQPERAPRATRGSEPLEERASTERARVTGEEEGLHPEASAGAGAQPETAAPAPDALPPEEGRKARMSRAFRGSAARVLAAGVFGALIGGGVMAGAVAVFDGRGHDSSMSREAETRMPGQGGHWGGQDKGNGLGGRHRDDAGQRPGPRGQQDDQGSQERPGHRGTGQADAGTEGI
ncbi:hypothetical protein ABGB12_00155 [Actinocorallia sp. B10E7]|uniref:hypothetical protein n=1 Tax=Actinocorallia sp. B10E7 TaxID=3153558 RepID=UPI00325CC868